MAGSSPRPHPSDLTGEQWALIGPLVPAKTGGRPARHSRRRIVDAILYVDRTGCAWRMMPHDFPPWGTVYWYFQRSNADGTTGGSTTRCAGRSGRRPDGNLRPGRKCPSIVQVWADGGYA
ncbi:transposase, partial [Arthrobacter mobilis]|nr:transposase [Arthrobacter mobilis]